MNPTATLTADAAGEKLWDVVVIGAGPAGCVTALELARAGCDVLLLEAKRFPRPKVCGGCLNRHTLALLRACGLEGILEEAGAVAVDELQLWTRHWHPTFPLPSGYSVTRSNFDARMLARTIAADVSYLDEATARLMPIADAGFRTVQIQQGAHQTTVRGRVVVCADGLSRSSVRHDRGLAVDVGGDAYVGAGVVVAEQDVPSVLRERVPVGTVAMVVGRGGYVGLAQAEEGQYSLGAAIRPALIKSEGSLGQAVTKLLADAGFPRVSELSTLQWHGTPLLKSRVRRPSGERLFLVGDSAGYLEPFTGQGMAWAIEGGIALAPIARLSVERWTPKLGRQWDFVYRRRVRRSQWVCRGLMQALHQPWFGRCTAAFVKRFPGTAQRMIAAINRPAAT